MKKLLSNVVFSCSMAIAVMGFSGLMGCAEQGTPAPPEDVQDPNMDESEEWLEGERAQH